MHSSSRRLLAAVAVSTVVAVVGTACSSGSGSTDTKGAGSGTYTIWDPYPQFDKTSDWAKLLDQCGTKAGVKVKRTAFDTSDLGNKTLLGFFDFPGLGLEPGVESIGSVQHIAISAPRDRWEEVRARLDEAGVPYAGPDRGIEESMYFKDPDGVQIELLSDPLMYFDGRQLDE